MELLILPTKRIQIKMKNFLIVISIIFSTGVVLAQEGEDVGWVARFGAAGGITPGLVFPNLDPINAQIKTLGIESLSNSGMFVLGGSGYLYIMMVDNLRIGGMGIGGSKSTSGTVLGMNKEVKYNYGFGGLTIEYSLPFINRIAVSVGTIIGAGSASIEVYQNRDNFTWNSAWLTPSQTNLNTAENTSRKFTNTFFTLTPTLNVDIPLNRFIAFRIGGGYIISFNDEWKVDNDKSITGIPSDMKSNSFFIQTGIYFGLFAF